MPIEIDLNAMKRSSIYFLGKHDFNAFRSIDCQAAKSERSIESVKIKKNKELVEIRITGRSFLHNQVRIMIGTLLNVGKGYWEIDKVKEIILSKKKEMLVLAPPHGLYLEKIFLLIIIYKIFPFNILLYISLSNTMSFIATFSFT